MKKHLSPAKAIHKYCLQCVCGSRKELHLCFGGCSGEFQPHKFGKGRVKLKTIRKHCIECSAGELARVRNCLITDCPIFPFRMGKNPSRKGLKGNPLIWRKTKLGSFSRT